MQTSQTASKQLCQTFASFSREVFGEFAETKGENPYKVVSRMSSNEHLASLVATLLLVYDALEQNVLCPQGVYNPGVAKQLESTGLCN